MTEEQAKYEVEKVKAPINIDITKGITPHTYGELLQFAALYKDSGLAPKSFTSVQQLAIAIGMCLELDRPILTGVQDMACINGRVSIFGDAALAIVRKSGLLEYIKETEEGTPYKDDWTFTCTIKRRGASDPRKGVWTWEDAKRAGFDDPKTRDGGKDIHSPWRRFTRRMMQFKARNFPLRDEFGDVIKGMTIAEDAQDIIDVTPTATAPGQSAATDDLTAAIRGKEEAPGPETPVNPDPNNYPCHIYGYKCTSERGLKKHITQSHPLQSEGAKKHFGTTSNDIKITGETVTEPPPAEPPAPPVNTIEPEEPPSDPGPVEEAPLFTAQSEGNEDDKVFFAEVGNYWDELEPKRVEKILEAFVVKSPSDIPRLRRGSFLKTCRQQLDKQLAGNGK